MLNSRTHTFISLTLSLLLLTILSACGSGITTTSGAKQTGSTTIEIGTDFPVSGREATTGKPIEDGVRLAIDEANASHMIPGYTFRVVAKDDVGPSGLHDPDVGAQNVTALIGDALVAGIIGPYNSSVARSQMPIANEAPIAMISPGTSNQCLTKSSAAVGCSGKNDIIQAVRPTGHVTYFRTITTDDHQGASAIYAYQVLHYRKVFIIDDAETYGIGVATTFKTEWQKLGGTLLGYTSEPGTTTSYLALLTQIAGMHPDLIYFGGLDSTGGIYLRQQMLQVPALKNTSFMGADGLATPSFASTIGLTGGPVYATLTVPDVTKDPAASGFVSKYEAAYGQLGAFSPAGYDSTNILLQAIKRVLASGVSTPHDKSDAAGAKIFRQAIINALFKTDYTGVTGHHTFDANGDTTNDYLSIYKLAAGANGKPAWIYQVQLKLQ